MSEDYRSVARDAQETIIIQKSRFIGRCFRISSEEEAIAHLETIRKEHWDASHNCYAYIVGSNGEAARFSDDGEPGGTAGLPIMEVLKARGLRNVLVIVTRYFGGILLGAGGLVRAYSKTAAAAIEAAGEVKMVWSGVFEIAVDYTLWGKIERKLRSMDANIMDIQYAQDVCARASIPASDEDFFKKEIIEISDGRIFPVLIEEIYVERLV